jgi:type IV pilus assembly protein PilQ
MAKDRTVKLIWALRLLLILLVILGLAARKHHQAAPSGKAASQSLTIQEIQAAADQVTIQADGPLGKATPFILGDPIRLMIDFENATVAAGVPASIPVGGDPIQTVEVATLPGNDTRPSTVRVQFDLAKDVEYQLQPSGNTLVIALTPRREKSPPAFSEDVYNQAKAVEEQIYTTGQYTPPPSGITLPRAGTMTQPAAPTPVAPDLAPPSPVAPRLTPLPHAPLVVAGTATQVTDILYRAGEHRFQVLIKANGLRGKYSPFTLDKPNRLVIDLPGLKLAAPKTTYPIRHSRIQRVRVGSHPDKTRVVIDFSGPIPTYSFSRAKQGLVVTLSLP